MTRSVSPIGTVRAAPASCRVTPAADERSWTRRANAYRGVLASRAPPSTQFPLFGALFGCSFAEDQIGHGVVDIPEKQTLLETLVVMVVRTLARLRVLRRPLLSLVHSLHPWNGPLRESGLTALNMLAPSWRPVANHAVKAQPRGRMGLPAWFVPAARFDNEVEGVRSPAIHAADVAQLSDWTNAVGFSVALPPETH